LPKLFSKQDDLPATNITEIIMYSKTIIIILFTLMVFLQGCNTFNGAKEGFKKDWIEANREDGWIKKNLW